MATLHNPERAWARPAALTSFDMGEVERRIGPAAGHVELLSGGLANLNLHIVGQGVLRIYRSHLGQDDLGGPAKEARLLSLPWRRLRVPRVLQQGSDFLLLEHVPHRELQDGVEQGRAVGAGLAEIHARHFSHAGLLSAELTLRESFGSGLEQLEQYGNEQLQRTGLAELAPRLRARLASARAVLAELEQPFVLLHSDFKLSNLHWAQDDRLLVLDWETAYAGPALLDIGQLLRWSLPEPFVQGFAQAYQEHGGQLPSDWQRHAEAFDAINLAGLLGGSEPGSLRAEEVAARLRRTLSERAK
ncbi:MAG: hypothetical protein RL033_73 [Pseudomonadota bacterium]